MWPNNEHQECTNKKVLSYLKEKPCLSFSQPALLKQVPTKLAMKLLLVKESELHILLPVCKSYNFRTVCLIGL